MPTEAIATSISPTKENKAMIRPPRTGSFLYRHIALISFIILLILLEIFVRQMKIPEYILPPPSKILYALYAGFATPIHSYNGFYVHLAATGISAGASFVGGALLGIAMGALVVRSAFAMRLFYPYIVSLQSVPKVALAPLFTVWFGLGFESKVVLGVLLTFFPVLVNTAAGLSSVDRDRLELMASMKATGWQTFPAGPAADRPALRLCGAGTCGDFLDPRCSGRRVRRRRGRHGRADPQPQCGARHSGLYGSPCPACDRRHLGAEVDRPY